MLKKFIFTLSLFVFLPISIFATSDKIYIPTIEPGIYNATSITNYCSIYSPLSWGSSYEPWGNSGCKSFYSSLNSTNPMEYLTGLTYSPRFYFVKDHDYSIKLKVLVHATDFDNQISPNMFNLTDSSVTNTFYFFPNDQALLESDFKYLYGHNENCLRWNAYSNLPFHYATELDSLSFRDNSYTPIGYTGYALYTITVHFIPNTSGYVSFSYYFQNKDYSIYQYGGKIDIVSNTDFIITDHTEYIGATDPGGTVVPGLPDYIGNMTSSWNSAYNSVMNITSFGLFNSILQTPLTALTSIINGTSQPLCSGNFTLGGKDVGSVCLPNGSILWGKQRAGPFITFINLFLGGILSFRMCLSLFNCVMNALDPNALSQNDINKAYDSF